MSTHIGRSLGGSHFLELSDGSPQGNSSVVVKGSSSIRTAGAWRSISVKITVILDVIDI